MMKSILSLALVGLSAFASGSDTIDFSTAFTASTESSPEGVYDVKAQYVVPGDLQDYVELDKVVVLRAAYPSRGGTVQPTPNPNSMFVFMVHSRYSIPLFMFFNAQYDPATKTISGEDQSPMGDLTSFHLKVEDGKLSGWVSDAKQGYNNLTGAVKRPTFNQLLRQDLRLSNSSAKHTYNPMSDMSGVYKGNLITKDGEMVVRRHPSGNLGVAYTSKVGTALFDISFAGKPIFDANKQPVPGFFEATHTTFGLHRMSRIYILAFRVPELDNKAFLVGMGVTASGNYYEFVFERTGDVEQPPAP